MTTTKNTQTLFKQLFPISWADEMEQGITEDVIVRNRRKCRYHNCYYCDIIWKNDPTRPCYFKKKSRKNRFRRKYRKKK